MEDDIIKLLDELGIEESTALLEEPIEMNIDPEVLDRIKYKSMQKVGFQTQAKGENKIKRFRFKRAFVCAAAFGIIVLGCTFTSGNATITSAFHKVLKFVPGYGYIESNEETEDGAKADETKSGQAAEYIYTDSFDALCTDEVDSKIVQIGVTNAYASGKHAKLMWTIANKNKKPISENYPEIELYVDGQKCEYVTGAVEKEVDWLYSGSYEYEIPDVSLSKSTTYEMRYEGVSLEYTLAACETIDDYDSVGTVVENNGVKLNTTSTYKNGVLTVDIYGVGDLPSEIDSAKLGGSEVWWEEEELVIENKTADVYLETEQGKINGKQVGYVSTKAGISTVSYEFKIPEGVTKGDVKMPYIEVMTLEEVIESIPIPNLNETVSWNKKLDFLFADIIIKEVSLKYKERKEESDNYYLELRFDNVSTKENIELYEIFIIAIERNGGYAKPIMGDGKLVGYDIYISNEDAEKDEIEYSFGFLNFYKFTKEYSFPITIDSNK